MSKDVGPIPGYGQVVHPSALAGDWTLGRISQEHGILVAGKNVKTSPEIGDWLRIVPQHACMTAAGHPWFLVVDGGMEVADIWVPAKGW